MNDILNPLQTLGQYTAGGGAGQVSTGQMQAMGANVPQSTAQLMMPQQNQGGIFAGLGDWLNNNGGAVSTGLEAFTGLANLYTGFKALGLQEDAFDFQKDAWWKNYNNQVQDYENQLRKNHRVNELAAAKQGRDYQTLDSYLGDRQLTGQTATNQRGG